MKAIPGEECVIRLGGIEIMMKSRLRLFVCAAVGLTLIWLSQNGATGS